MSNEGFKKWFEGMRGYDPDNTIVVPECPSSYATLFNAIRDYNKNNGNGENQESKSLEEIRSSRYLCGIGAVSWESNQVEPPSNA